MIQVSGQQCNRRTVAPQHTQKKIKSDAFPKHTPFWLFLHSWLHRFSWKKPGKRRRHPWAPYAETSDCALVLQSYTVTQTVVLKCGSTGWNRPHRHNLSPGAFRSIGRQHGQVSESVLIFYLLRLQHVIIRHRAWAETAIWQAKTFPYVPC